MYESNQMKREKKLANCNASFGKPKSNSTDFEALTTETLQKISSFNQNFKVKNETQNRKYR